MATEDLWAGRQCLGAMIPGIGLHLGPDAGREGEHPWMSTLRGSRCLVGVRCRFRVVPRRAGRGSR